MAEEKDDKVDLARRVLLGATIFGGAAVSAGVSLSAAQPVGAASSGVTQRGELLLKGGYVLSMDSEVGDLPVGDVHIRDGEIIAVAPSIDAPEAQIINAENMVVMPGFVETHWHMVSSLWRGMVNDASEYFSVGGLSAAATSDERYIAVRYAALEALNAGVTTCHNWSGVQGYDDALTEMQALVDTGIRSKMGYPGAIRGEATSREQMQRAMNWLSDNAQGRVGLGILIGGEPDQLEAQVALGRALELRPITDHGAAFASRPEIVGPEFIYTHGTDISREQIQLIADRNAKVALCPLTDPMIGAGLPPVIPLLDGGVPLENLSFSVDVNAQTPVDPFGALRALVNAGRIQQAGTPSLGEIATSAPDWRFSYRDALYLGTIGGANVLGLRDQVGSLRPGKRADLIMVRTDMLNMLPVNDTDMSFQLVQHGLPSNIDTVIVDGYVRKRNGSLVDVDVPAIMAETAAVQRAIRSRAGR